LNIRSIIISTVNDVFFAEMTVIDTLFNFLNFGSTTLIMVMFVITCSCVYVMHQRTVSRAA